MTITQFIFLFSFLTLLATANKSLDQQLAEIKKLPKLTQKKIAVILGTIVADAAATPLLWIYDEKVFKTNTSMLQRQSFPF